MDVLYVRSLSCGRSLRQVIHPTNQPTINQVPGAAAMLSRYAAAAAAMHAASMHAASMHARYARCIAAPDINPCHRPRIEHHPTNQPAISGTWT